MQYKPYQHKLCENYNTIANILVFHVRKDTFVFIMFMHFMQNRQKLNSNFCQELSTCSKIGCINMFYNYFTVSILL